MRKVAVPGATVPGRLPKRRRGEAPNKLQQAVFVESKFAIVETSQRVRALLTAG